MDSYEPLCHRKHGMKIILLLFIIAATSEALYNIGVGIADVTGPSVEIVFLGYARIEQKGSGIHLRTFSRAFIIDDGVERFVFVSVDGAMVGHDIRSAVILKLKEKYGNLYNEKNVMISATHTHSGPGGYMMDVLFDLTTFGFNKQAFHALVDGIANSIERAHNSMIPGRIRIAVGEILDANINRSPQAYLNNPEKERLKYEHNVDKTMTQLQFVGANNQPIGVINWFAVHPTSMNNTNQLLSSDNVGYASILFEKVMNGDAMIGKGPFVAAFASSNLGDSSPNTRGPKCEFSGLNCSVQYTCPGKLEMCFASGPGRDMFESTSIIAHKLLDESLRLWRNSEISEITGPVRVIHRYVDMPQQRATFHNETTGMNEEVHGCEPAMGYSFAAGTTDGPGSFAFEQGTTTSNPFWNAVRNFIAAPSNEDIKCHGAKPILLATGRMRLPYQWQPKIISTHVAFLGNFVIAGVPGEFTTMSGRRLRETIKDTISESNTYQNAKVVIAGLVNTYSDYITTPEEYEIQRYEGASTIYGPHTLTIYLQQYAELAKAILNNSTLDPGPEPVNLGNERLISLVPPVLYDTPQWGHEFGECLLQPPQVAKPGDTISVKFVSGNLRNNLMTERSFLTVEKLNGTIWIPVATDADWETKIIWERTSFVLGSSEVTITWHIPTSIDSGEYRIRHEGYYQYILGGKYPYKGSTKIFQVNQ